MKVSMEITPYEFKYEYSWSGGRDTCDDLDIDEIGIIMILLEDSSEEDMSITELNDFFWFDRETIANWLGYEDYDELLKRDEEEEEE